MNDQPEQGAEPGRNTYFFDSESPEELVRLLMLDQTIAKAMGGVLAGLPPLREDAKVIDLACGPGGWVLDVAYALPEAQVCGVDISRRMIDYANARAYSQGLRNASFGVMDITHPLDFADHSFDLVNARFVTTVLPTDSWPAFLQECRRITRPGGIIRFTETEFIGFTNSAAYNQIALTAAKLLKATKHGFFHDGRSFGILPVIARLLQKAGIEQVEQKIHMLNFSAGTDAWTTIYHDMQTGRVLALRMLEKLGIPSDEDRHNMDQALLDMQGEEFCGIWWFISSWGHNPSN